MNNSIAALMLILVGIALLLGFQGAVGLLFLSLCVLLALLLLWLNRKGAVKKTGKEPVIWPKKLENNAL
jgi:hypothetical protein